MSLDDKLDFEPSWKETLLTLDYAIWRMHGKIVDKAYEKLGWDKYDCADQAGVGLGVGSFLLGAYSGMEVFFIENSKIYSYSLPAFLMYAGATGIKERKKEHGLEREKEFEKIAKSGSVPIPTFHKIEGIRYLGAIFIAADFTSNIFFGDEQLSPLNLARTHTIAAFGGYLFFRSTIDYFKRQILQPPKTKKKFLPALHQAFKNKFQRKPELKPVPVKTVQEEVA